MPSSRALARFSYGALGAGLALLLGLGAIGLREIRRLESAFAWIQHSREVLAATDRALQLLTQAESGARGFVLIGTDEALAPFESARVELGPLLDRLGTKVADNADQARRAEALGVAARERLARLEEIVEARRLQGADPARALVAQGLGLDAMRRARERVAEFHAAEDALLAERRAVGDRRERTTRLALAALAGAAPLFLGVAVALNRRAIGLLREAQAAAQLGETKLRTTLQSCGDGLIVTDAAGRVTLINPVAEALTGWRAEQALGLPVEQVFQIVNEHTRETVESPVSKALREGKIVGLANHTVLIARDGRELPIDDSGAPIADDRGEPVGVILVFRDVTARKLSEQARERLLRAEAERRSAVEANAAKDEFLALLSHELRSPLAAIRGWIDLLRNGMLVPAEVPGALERVHRNARLQERLVSDLLDISRILAGKLEIVRAPTDLAEVARGAVEGCSPVAEAKGVVLRLDTPGRRLLVLGDEERLRQAIDNLIGNAIKFTPRGGTVRVAVGASDGRARVFIEDTGIGMGAEVLDRLFERFWQADATRTRSHGGLGLGLPIAKFVVEEHEGTLSASSPGEGRGSTFVVTLPLAEVEPRETPCPAPDASEDLAGLRILLVDDDGDGREALGLFLERRNAIVFDAASVREALERYARERPSVIVSDVAMPGEDGHALAREIRERERRDGSRTPMIALTGFAAAADRREAFAQGFDAHLSKPVDPFELARSIARLARKPGSA